MSMIPITHFLYLSFALFVIGMIGVLARRNVLIILMSIELMLNGANIALVAFARQWGDMTGQVMAMFIIAVAAAEAAVGLAIVVSIFRARTGTDVDDLSALRD
jgi:NADH-quinone oxidoreductase subunit K